MAKYGFTTSFEKIASFKKTVRIIQGGKGSSKTISILQHFTMLALSKKKGLILSVVADSLPNLKSGAIRDFEKILTSWGLWGRFKRNKTDNTYFCGGNLIEFFSVEGEGSRLGSRRTHLYVNEADMIKFSTFIELYSRTSVFTVMDYNPRREFWAHLELIGQEHVDFIILNFAHNEFIPKNEKDSILWFKKKADEGSEYFKNKWRVLGLGLLGVTEGVIFDNWKEKDFVPKEATYLGACVDWGFNPDPATIIKIYKFNGEIYCKELMYQKDTLNDVIAKVILSDNEARNGIVIADSAEKKSIAEMRARGIKMIGAADKNILAGIDLMQGFKYNLVGKNMVKEWKNYCYKMDKAGVSLGVPVDDWNHTIDPIRYFTMDVLSRSSNQTNTYKAL